jgi:hypothetical protein
VCSVAGEADHGKTSLVTEFAQRALAERKEMVVSVWRSDAQTGVGDAGRVVDAQRLWLHSPLF